VFRTIVVGTDGSETAQTAVDAAVELARLSGASLELVSASEAALDAAGARAGAAGVTAQLHAREGDAADAILDVAEELGADLIVVGNKGVAGAERFLLGSVPDRVTHHAPCAVMIPRTS
jgi:nucleotide-binding universal stress UspA family protein